MEITLTAEHIKLVNLIEHYFTSPLDTGSGKLFYTTMNLFDKLQSVYPSDSYTPELVCESLIYLNISTINGAGDKIFWYLEER